MNRKHKTKSILLQGTSLLLFFALAFGTTAVSAGLIGGRREEAETTKDLPAAVPSVSTSVTTQGNTSPAPETGDPPSTDEQGDIHADYATNLSKTFNTALIEGYVSNRAQVSLSQRIQIYNRLTANLGKSERTVSPISYQSYDSSLYEITRRASLDYDYLTGTETIIEYTKQLNNYDSSYVTVANRLLVGRKTVQPYMGYLIVSKVEDGKTVLSLCDANGNLLVDNLGTKTPYYARDYSNNPVFEDEDGNLYAFTGTKFKSVGKGDLRIYLFYDYPAYPLGTYKSTYESHYNPSTGKYQYINYKNKRTHYSTSFFKAFNYASNGLAVTVSAEENILQVVNYRGKVMFKPGRQYIYYTDPVTGKRQHARDFYAFPDTYGIESIGSAGYDNGWLRLRIRTASMMSDSLGAVIRDQDFLVDESGNKFPVPEGYTIEGYSDGVLLLSKDGLYGYYSIKGDWIAQPIYTYARPFIQGLAVVGSADGTVGMIDTKGNIVLPFVFTSLSDVSSGIIVGYCEGIGWETFAVTAK